MEARMGAQIDLSHVSPTSKSDAANTEYPRPKLAFVAAVEFFQALFFVRTLSVRCDQTDLAHRVFRNKDPWNVPPVQLT